MNTQEIKCALCDKDISAHGTPKHRSLHSIEVNDAEAVLCGNCAKLDLNTAHAHYTSKDRITQALEPVNKELSKYHKLFGNLYIRL